MKPTIILNNKQQILILMYIKRILIDLNKNTIKSNIPLKIDYPDNIDMSRLITTTEEYPYEYSFIEKILFKDLKNSEKKF